MSNFKPVDSDGFQTGAETVVYACSGCSDAGELADRIARRLALDGKARMSCLAGIGGRVKPLMAAARNARRILVIDGCPSNCARHTLLNAGIAGFDHLALHDIGLLKGKCPATESNIEAGTRAVDAILAQARGSGGSQ